VGATSSNQNVDIYADIEDPATFDEEHLRNRKPHLVALDESARGLYCQGIMLAVFAQQNGIIKPRVGLLTIGKENHKGSDTILRTDYLFRKQTENLENFLEYVGKIEPKDALLERRVDIVVTEGHTGNLLLKLAEAIIKALKGIYKDTEKNLSTIKKMLCLPAGVMLRKDIQNLRGNYDPDFYNAGILLGYLGLVGKGHGDSCEDAIYYGMKRTAECISRGVSCKLDEALEAHMPKKPRYSAPVYATDKKNKK